MSDVVIQVERLTKKYDLGVIGSGTLKHDLNRWWSRLRGRGDPYAPIDAAHKLPSNGTNGKNGSAEHSTEEIWALRDVSFEVQQGEILGIIGRNGAGKSTLLKILSRTTAPTAGEVRVKGRIASLLEVGTGFHPDLTGRENVFLNGAILGMTHREIRRKFDEIVAFSEVERFIDTPVKRYSSGMYVRLAFAVAAHLEPEILIVDEVLAVGDLQFQKKCLGKIQDVSKTDGRTVLFVSHNMQAVSALTNHCIVLAGGAIHSIGRTTDVVRDYEESMLEEHANSGSVNLSHASRAGGDQVIRFTSITLKNTRGEIRSSFAFGEAIVITLELESKIDSKEFEIGFGVRTLEGTLLFASSSSDSGELKSIAKGRYLIDTRMDPNYLKPGTFHIAIGVTCGSLRDAINEAILFEINSAAPVTKSPLINLPGKMQFDYEWNELKLLSQSQHAVGTT